MIKVFDSVRDLVLYGDKVNAWRQQSDGRPSWYNNETWQMTRELSLKGDRSLVSQAEQMLGQLETDIETPRRVWESAPMGAYCIVPDVLSGRPGPMRRLTHIADEHAPITILVCSSSSAGINANTLLRRGVTILALVMALSRVRPVTLWTVATLHGKDNGETILSTRIVTDPLDTATACYVLTSAGFARRLTYGIGYAINHFDGRWPLKFQYHNPKPYYDYLAQTLSPDPKRTLVIGAAQLGDELLATPLVWIRKQIDRFVTTQEEELV